MQHLKLSLPFGQLFDLRQFTSNYPNQIGNWQIHANDGILSADAWVVLEGAPADDSSCSVPDGQFYFATSEVIQAEDYYSESPSRLRYLDQFDHILTCHPMLSEKAERHVPFLPWMVNANHGPSVNAPHPRDLRFFEDLVSLPKSKTLSVFCSNKTYTAEQVLRLRFVERLAERYKDRLDWFGNGIRSVPEKWDGLAAYRYTLALENKAAPDVLTEKVQDAFLALSFPLYWGAPNIADYFDPDGFRSIDIGNWKASCDAIDEILESDPYEQTLPALLENKRRVLEEMHYLRRLIRRIEVEEGRGPTRLRSLAHESRIAGLGSRWRRAAGTHLQHIGARLTR